MKYKLFLSDVDGTLTKISKHARPSLAVKQAIKQAQEKVLVGVATGRAYFLVKYVLEDLGITGPCIVEDGTRIVKGDTGEVLWERRIQEEDYKKVLDIIKSYDVVTIISTGDHHISYSPEKHIENPLNMFLDELTHEQADELMKKLSVIPTIHTNKFSSWAQGKLGITICHGKASKHYAMVKLIEMLDIKPEEVIGIGDGYNDFPLLMACGLKVAMGNAIGDLKAIADYIAPTVDEDGVAKTIQRFVLQNK
jgi:HAD superfamily hydrolase (TIGR01484 family)